MALSSLLVTTFPSGEGEAGLAYALRDNSEESCRFCHPWLLLLEKNDFFFSSPSSSFFRKRVPTGSEKRAHTGKDTPFRPPTLFSQLQGAWPLRGLLLRGGHPPLLYPEVCVQPSEDGVPQTLGACWRGVTGPPRSCSQVTVSLTVLEAPFPPPFCSSLESRRSLMCQAKFLTIWTLTPASPSSPLCFPQFRLGSLDILHFWSKSNLPEDLWGFRSGWRLSCLSDIQEK